ncbi:glycosyltransferase family 87 protein [Oryzihumus sp.]
MGLPFAVVAALNLAGVTFSPAWRHGYDLAIYRESVHAWWATGSPYSWATQRGLGFTYPPVALLAFVPWALLNQSAAWVLCVLLIAVAGTAFCRWWSRLVAPGASLATLSLGAAVLAVTDPVNDAMALGQVSPFIGAAAVAAVAAVPSRAGAWAGVGAAVKITPLADLAAFWFRPDRLRRTAYALGAALVLTLFGVLLAPAASWAYWTSALWDTRRVGRTGSASNTSLPGLFAHAGLADRPALLAGVGLTALLAVGWWALALRRHSPDRLDLALAAGVLTLLATPVSWSHHGLAVCLGWATLALRGRRLLALAGAVLWTLPVFELAGRLDGPLQLAVQSVRPLSAVLLLWLLAGARSRVGDDAAAPDPRASVAQASG